MTSQQHPVRAALWMIGAILGFSSMAVAGRAIGDRLDTFEIMLYRSATGVAAVAAVAWAAGRLSEIDTRRMDLHLLRNTAHFAGQNLWLYALTLIPLAQLFALEFSYPILVALAAPLFLGERLTARGLLAAAIGFAGILIVARPWGAGGLSVGLLAALGSALGFAGSAIVTKRMTRSVSITCILFWLCTIQLALGLACAGWDGRIAPPAAPLLWPLAVIGVAGLVAHYCLTRALTLAPASIVTPIDFLRLPLIGLVGMALYGEPLDLWVFLGGAVILAANLMNLAPTRGTGIVAPVHPDATSLGKAD